MHGSSSAMDLNMTQYQNIIGVEYCTGYVDRTHQWRQGFFCPPKPRNDSRVFCCGTPQQKYCCSFKDFGSKSQHSFGTLVTVATITFILTVLLTIVIFMCCKKYWKYRTRNLEMNEIHFYQMGCSNSNAPLVSTHSQHSFSPPQTLHSPLSPLTAVNAVNNGSEAIAEPPPPYTTHETTNESNVYSINLPNIPEYRIEPSKNAIKPQNEVLWRKLSQ